MSDNIDDIWPDDYTPGMPPKRSVPVMIVERYAHEAMQQELDALQARVAALEGELLEALTELVGWRAIYGGDIGALQQRARELMKEGRDE